MDINRYSPSYVLKKKHLIGLTDYSSEEIFEILYAVKALKRKFEAHEETPILHGTTVALMFADTSIRTRSAIEIGTNQLGGTCVNLPYSKKDMGAGENIRDTVNVISRYGVGALITRGIDKKMLNDFTSISEMPIINSHNEECVPIQALCDLYTIWEKMGELSGVKLAIVGKGTSTISSFMIGAVKCGMDVSIAMPEGYGLKRANIEAAEQLGKINFTDNPVPAVRDADIVYTCAYRYHSVITEEEKEALAPYRVDAGLMSYAKHSALFMHPLPATRGLEVTADVIDGKRSAVYDQGANRLHTIKAILTLLAK
ncbi:MAG: ornithine carbamoyltransferase [Clostridia bacterium]|nr:ornithine carbamoyltransferase [Clostridia bacterium]